MPRTATTMRTRPAANPLDELKTAVAQIEALMSQLKDLDREEARIEADIDPTGMEELDADVSRQYDDLYEAAKQLWRSMFDIADEYEIDADKYLEDEHFESNLVLSAATNA